MAVSSIFYSFIPLWTCLKIAFRQTRNTVCYSILRFLFML